MAVPMNMECGGHVAPGQSSFTGPVYPGVAAVWLNS